MAKYSISKGALIDNYIYFYHTNDLIIIPLYADSISDTMAISFSQSTILTRSAPIQSFSNAGPRSISVQFNLHRDMMDDINLTNGKIVMQDGEDAIDTLIREILAAALPSYDSATKMVNPPIVAARFGDDIFIKGVISQSVGITYKCPIIPGRNKDRSADYSKNRYSNVDISFNIIEIDPYDAETIKKMGSFRGLSTSLERKILSANVSTLTQAQNKFSGALV